MLLRIVRIQPPIDVTRIVIAGRIACLNASPANVHVQPTFVRDVVAAALRQPAELDREEPDREQREPEVRERRGDHEDRRQDAVEHAAAPPRRDETDQRAEDEGEDRRHADEAERPRQRLQDIVRRPGPERT